MAQTTKQTRSRARGAGARTARCADIGCPMAVEDGAEECRDCPGADFFTRHHECGKCRFDGRGDRRCVVCQGPSDEPSHKGASHVSIDAMPDGGTKILQSRIDTSIPHAPLAMSEGESDVAHRVMAFFTALSLDEFALVKHLVAGGNLNTYASVNNKPRQYVWNTMKAMLGRFPEIRVLVKERKQPNGRKPRQYRDNPLQMMLF